MKRFILLFAFCLFSTTGCGLFDSNDRNSNPSSGGGENQETTMLDRLEGRAFLA